jgi:beta-lactam-binding protein with PASTA domain
MYYNSGKNILISFFVALITSVVVCLIFLLLLPHLKSGGSGDIVVPDFLGSTTEQARVITEARNLLLIVGGEEENEKYPENSICRQAPLAGSVVRGKTTITVFISKGSSQIILPDFKGQSLSEATIKLGEYGLKTGEVRAEENAQIARDKVISTIPAAGTRVRKGDAITFVVSQGQEEGTVPNLIGRALSSAKRIGEDNGFVVGNVSYEVSTEIDVGIVMAQRPGAGTKLIKGSKINIVVATVLD